MFIVLEKPLSRKSYDTYTVIKHFFPDLPVKFISEKRFENLIVSLLYGPKDSCQGEGILLPQEVKIIESIYKSSKTSNYLFPDATLFDQLNNKAKFSLLCEELNINHPRTWQNTFELDKTEKLIFKPIFGQGSKGIFIKDGLSGKIEVPDGYLCQQFLGDSNEIWGFNAMAIDGVVSSCYSHKRVITWPRKGGVTVYSEKVDDDTLVSAGKEVVRKLNYTGLLMIEFKRHNQDWIVIEINPRLWGSLLFCLTEYPNPITEYLTSFDVEVKNKSVINKSNIVWLFPYGIFDIIIWKNLKHSIIINARYPLSIFRYIKSSLIILMAKLMRYS